MNQMIERMLGAARLDNATYEAVEHDTEADMGQVMRTLAFAQAPGLIRVFGFIPVIGPLIHLVAAIWMIATMVVAVRQSLDYESTGRAIGVVVLGFVVYILVFGLLIAMTGGGGNAPQ